MARNCIEFSDLLTHYFVSEGIQVTLRYPANLSIVENLRLWLCSADEYERPLRTNVRKAACQNDSGGDWVRVSVDVPPTELEGLNKGEYWLRCECYNGGQVEEVGQCAPFVLCIEPRDIPSFEAANGCAALCTGTDEHGPMLTRSASFGSGSFILVDDEDSGSLCNSSRFQEDDKEEDETSVTEEPASEGNANPSDHASELVSEMAVSVTSRGTQTDEPTTVAATDRTIERSAQTDSTTTTDATVKRSTMIASSTYVNALGDAEVSILKSNNRDLMVKVRKLAEKVQALEQEKELNSRDTDERAKQLKARLIEAESELQLFRSRLLDSDAEKATLVKERDSVLAANIALATERDGLCAELLRIKDEYSATLQTRDTRQIELQSKTEELNCAEKKVKEQEGTLKFLECEFKVVFERCTQLEGKLLSKENELKVAQERLAECTRRMNEVLAESQRTASAGRNAGGTIGDKDKEEMAARERRSRRKERPADSNDRPKVAVYTNRPAITSTQSKSAKLHVYTTGATNLVHARPKDEFVTGVNAGESGVMKVKRRNYRHHHHSTSSCLSPEPKCTVPPSSGPVETIGEALPTSLQKGRARSEEQLVGERETPLITCPVCQKTLHSRETEKSAALHVQYCLQRRERQDESILPSEGI